MNKLPKSVTKLMCDCTLVGKGLSSLCEWHDPEPYIDALKQVLTDINDPHPRNSTLTGLRNSLKATEAMILNVLSKV